MADEYPAHIRRTCPEGAQAVKQRLPRLVGIPAWVKQHEAATGSEYIGGHVP